jgi:hypothetical protein
MPGDGTRPPTVQDQQHIVTAAANRSTIGPRPAQARARFTPRNQRTVDPGSDQKSWVREIVKDVILLVVGGLVTLAVTQLTKDPPPDPPPGPSSGRASLILQDIPSPANDWTLRMTGGGWEGDSSVEVTYPTGLGDTQTTEVPLHPEKKLLDHEVVAVNLPAGEYTVKARGVQSGTELTETFTVP